MVRRWRPSAMPCRRRARRHERRTQSRPFVQSLPANPLPVSFVSSCGDRQEKLMSDSIRDILYALRGFRRAPLAALTIVATVSIGLGLVAVAFTVLNALLFRVDAVPNVHELFAVERPPTSDGDRQRFTRAQSDALLRETNVFTNAYAQLDRKR